MSGRVRSSPRLFLRPLLRPLCFAWAACCWLAGLPPAEASDADAMPAGLPVQVLAAPPDPDGERPQWLPQAVRLFDQGALANELHNERPVTRWPGPIDIAVRGDAGAA